MFPMEFDYQMLSGLPLPTEERIGDVTALLRLVVEHRVVSYFKAKRGTDPLKIGKLEEHLAITRLEDERGRARTVSLLSRDEDVWNIQIHERIFDFLAFVFPTDTEAVLGEGTVEEQKMLAFMELLLRHEVDHILYPDRTQRQVIASDVEYALDCRTNDPSSYRMLRKALADEMNGIKGGDYLSLFDRAEQQLPYLDLIGNVMVSFVSTLSDMPEVLLDQAFPLLDEELKARVLGENYRRSRDSSLSIMERASALRNVLRLFSFLAARNEKEAQEVFHSFKDRWGLVELFRELGLPESSVNGKAPQDLFKLFRETLDKYLGEKPAGVPGQPASAVVHREAKASERPQKSLTDRIEEARNSPDVPARVIEVIDKNKVNAVGHSGSKYSELIETLLAIPWRKIKRIEVTPRAFEEGLDRTHYGLRRPKEMVCDFFANLIWRYQHFDSKQAEDWHRNGSAFLFVGPPGVGKTSLAISIARNLDIPYHKISLGGMRDEADLRGHGFTYEGSKPGAIVQGLIKMEVMNGMFILDEADKTEKFAIATLLEILDPEQNHLFHDKYTETTVDIDLSNCHFLLTANTLDGVPPVVINRCEVIFLDRYSIEEKIAIAQKHLVGRLRSRYQIDERQIYFDPAMEADLLRYLIRDYTYEAGVRELERVIRTLFLRIQRKEIFSRGERSVRITREKIKQYLDSPNRPRQISREDQVGEMLGLGVDAERGVGSVIPIQATRIGIEAPAGRVRRAHLSITHATGNIEKIMDESRKVATTGIFHCARALNIDLQREEPVHLHFMGGSTRKDGPSAGGAIALALASLLSGRKIRRDVAMTGEIDTKGRISAVGALALKIETASNAGCRTVIIPRENLYGEEGIERFPDALKEELQILTFEEWQKEHAPFDYLKHILEVVAVDDIAQAAEVACLDENELEDLRTHFLSCAREVAQQLSDEDSPGRSDRVVSVVQIKGAEEFDPGIFECPWMAENELTLLVPPGIRHAITERLSEATERVKIYDFDPKVQNLSTAVHDIMTTAQQDSSRAVRLSLIAPYYFLKRDGISADVLLSKPPFGGVRLSANNYTRQNVKIKGCKAVLDRFFCLLGSLDESRLDICPFLAVKDGVHVLDMSFIPEKYRLDVKRAERLIKEWLNAWLRSVESLRE